MHLMLYVNVRTLRLDKVGLLLHMENNRVYNYTVDW